MSRQALSPALIQGLRELGEDPANHPCDLYLAFIEELIRWNKAYNLTAIREPGLILTHHILDSLSVLPYLHGDRCLDIGTGAGLPGMILALARKQSSWTLLDSKIKKIRFLQHILREFKPGNVEIAHARAENFRPERPFTTIITRAVASLAEFRRITAHLQHPDCRLLAMKGGLPGEELAEITETDREVIKLKVPGLESKRCLVIIR